MKCTAVLLALLLTAAPAHAEPRPQVVLPGLTEPHLVFSADGQRLAVQLQHQVHVLDRGGLRLQCTVRGYRNILGCSLNPTGSLLAIGDYPRTLHVVHTKSGQTAWTFAAPTEGQKGDEAGALDPEFSPTSDWLLAEGRSHGISYNDRHVRLVDGLSGRVAHSWLWGAKFRDGSWTKQAWSWDGKWIIRLARDKMQTYAPQSGKRIAEVRLGGDFFDQRSTPQGCEVGHESERGSRSVRELYSLPKLERRQHVASREAAFHRNPEGTLEWTEGAQGEPIVNAGTTEIYRGQPKEQIRSWVPGGGFVLAHPDGAMHLVSAEGKDLGTSSWDGFQMVPGTSFAFEGTGYGRAQRFYDFRTGKKLGGLTYSSGGAVTRDGRRMAVSTRRGILILDVERSLAQGKLQAAR